MSVIVYIKMLPPICITMYSSMMEELAIKIHKQMIQLNIYQTRMYV